MKMSLSHILVTQKYEAEDLKRKLQEGIPFADLAKQFSTCPSSVRGGSLGHIELKRLDADFAEAAAKLEAGEVSEVVKTKFGHHLIRHDEAVDGVDNK